MLCNLCPRECNAKRNKYFGEGFCKCGTLPKVARIAPHMYEEPCISSKFGSGAIFFSGCTLKCVYCQNYDISHKNYGKYIDENILAEEYKRLENMGVHNIEFVTATQYIDTIIKSLEIYKPSIPLIYNCSGYEKEETLKRLNGLIDIYLPDFKYSDNTLALKLSKCKNYTETVISAIKEMLNQTGKYIIQDGIMKKGVIIRHLVLPNHTKNSIGVLKIIKENFSNNVMTSLMAQYTPCKSCEDIPELNRKITQREYDKVLDKLFELELEGFAQELTSASKDYIPKWDYK